MEPERRITLWSRNKLFVDAHVRADGSLVIEGQDLTSPNMWGTGEYEYALTVEPADVPRIVADLGGAEGDDVLALLAANAERIVRAGERTWLRGLGIDAGFWNRIGD